MCGGDTWSDFGYSIIHRPSGIFEVRQVESHAHLCSCDDMSALISALWWLNVRGLEVDNSPESLLTVVRDVLISRIGLTYVADEFIEFNGDERPTFSVPCTLLKSTLPTPQLLASSVLCSNLTVVIL